MVKANSVRFDEDSFWVELSDGRTLGAARMVPEAAPRLARTARARLDQHACLHWEELDEDISIGRLLAGRGNQMRPGLKEQAT